MKRKEEKGEGDRDRGERGKDEISMIAKLQQEVELLLRTVEHRMQRLQGELTLGFHYLQTKPQGLEGPLLRHLAFFSIHTSLYDEDPVESET